MSTATAKLSQYRQAPRKVRLVANLVRGKSVEQAILELEHRAKRAAPVFAKLIMSAVANAKVAGLEVKDLKVSELRVDKGPIIKRSRPRAQGRAFPIHKHTSHIIVTLSDGASVKTAKKIVAKKEATPEVKSVKAKPVTKKTKTTK